MFKNILLIVTFLVLLLSFNSSYETGNFTDFLKNAESPLLEWKFCILINEENLFNC